MTSANGCSPTVVSLFFDQSMLVAERHCCGTAAASVITDKWSEVLDAGP